MMMARIWPRHLSPRTVIIHGRFTLWSTRCSTKISILTRISRGVGRRRRCSSDSGIVLLLQHFWGIGIRTHCGIPPATSIRWSISHHHHNMFWSVATKGRGMMVLSIRRIGSLSFVHGHGWIVPIRRGSHGRHTAISKHSQKWGLSNRDRMRFNLSGIII